MAACKPTQLLTSCTRQAFGGQLNSFCNYDKSHTNNYIPSLSPPPHTNGWAARMHQLSSHWAPRHQNTMGVQSVSSLTYTCLVRDTWICTHAHFVYHWFTCRSLNQHGHRVTLTSWKLTLGWSHSSWPQVHVILRQMGVSIVPVASANPPSLLLSPALPPIPARLAPSLTSVKELLGDNIALFQRMEGVHKQGSSSHQWVTTARPLS